MSSQVQDLDRLTMAEKRARAIELLQKQAGLRTGAPLSFGQERLWFLSQLDPASPAYNVPVALRIRGELKVDELRRAFDRIVERHEILRTRYRAENGMVFQEVISGTPVDFEMADLAGREGCSSEAAIERWLKTESRIPFQLSEGRMLRARLGRLASDDHVLLVVLHHIASDEWSLRILLEELTAYYREAGEARGPAMPDLPIQYADFAVWQRDWFRGEILERQLGYWCGKLQGDLPRMELPSDFPVQTRSSGRGAREMRLVKGAAELERIAQGRDATLLMALLAAFKTLLFRYTGQAQVVAGLPMSGRTRVETEPLIGFFVNTLVLRTDLSGNPTFVELLGRIRETALGAFAHQEMPFEKLVQELRPERGAGQVPLIQTMFALEEAGERAFTLPGVEVEWLDVHNDTAKLDWTVVAKRCGSGSGLVLKVEYNRELFLPERMQRMLGHFESLIEGIIKDPGARISELPLLTEMERDRALAQWSVCASEYPREATIVELFERQAVARPNALAVVYDGTDGWLEGAANETGEASAGHDGLTYDQLNRRANRLAHQLRALGVGREVKVGLCVERSVDLVAGMVGILKAGGAYVPLDPGYPKDRLAFMVADAQAPVIVTQHRFRNSLPAGRGQILFWEELDEALPDTNPAGCSSATDLAYVIYTSGSTGRPKGVLIPNRAVVRLVCGTNYVRLQADDRVAQVANANFDAATFEIWGALLNGGCVVGLAQDIALSPKDFARHLRWRRVTTLFLTTALFNQLAREAPEAFGSLRHLLFGGEAVDAKWVRRVLRDHRPERLLHVYGPTESTTFATWFEIESIPDEALTIPIGRPIANTEVYLLDVAMQAVAIGVAGEIFIGGDGLARGYLNQADWTAERFVANPFSQSPGTRLYRTGDLGRFRPDGAIEFIGRRDHQVKIRGFRVELEEIEAVLVTHPSVREAVVVARRDDVGGVLRLVAYPVFKGPGAETDLAELRRHLKEKLPEYMAPSMFVPLSELPLNSNGKVDRNSLPAPDSGRMMQARSYERPRDRVEQELARIWEAVLGVNQVGVNDNFFEIGGHSLLAVRLFSEIERIFHKKLPLATLFQSPTVGQLAGLIAKDRAPQRKSLLVGIQPLGDRRPFYWIHSLGGDGGGAFFYYRKLASLLGPDQPSFGIRSPEEPFIRIEPMAAHYIEQLVAFQPEGPYLLGGFCFGGNVAFEMARQLVANGREVGLLVLLESAAPDGGSGGRVWKRQEILPLLTHLQSWLAEFVQQSPDEFLARLQHKRRSMAKLLQRILTFGKREAEIPLADVLNMADYPVDYVKFAQAHWEALLHYVPQSYPGRVILFRARKQPLSRCDPTLGWGGLAEGGVAVNVIPGSHEKMIEEPNVQVLASELKACLAEVHAG